MRRLAYGLLSLGAIALYACSSSSSGTAGQSLGGTGSGAGSAGHGGSSGSSAGAAGSKGASAGAAGSGVSGAGGAAGAAAGGAGGGAGSSGSATDITQSAECAAFCGKAEACGASCDRSIECSIDIGSCAEAQRALLDCKATTGSFYCSADGFAVLSECQLDTSVCGMVIGEDGGLSCMPTLTDDNCVGCQAEQCTTTYNDLVDASDVYTLGACIEQCETSCGTPYMCPDMCASAAPVSYGIFQTLRTCGITSCPQYCSATTVVL